LINLVDGWKQLCQTPCSYSLQGEKLPGVENKGDYELFPLSLALSHKGRGDFFTLP
jgi:hypothetical protein